MTACDTCHLEEVVSWCPAARCLTAVALAISLAVPACVGIHTKIKLCHVILFQHAIPSFPHAML